MSLLLFMPQLSVLLWKYPYLMSYVEYMRSSPNQSKNTCVRRVGYTSLTVTVFRILQLIKKLGNPSSFGKIRSAIRTLALNALQHSCKAFCHFMSSGICVLSVHRDEGHRLLGLGFNGQLNAMFGHADFPKRSIQIHRNAASSSSIS